MPADLNTLNEIIMDSYWVESQVMMRTPLFADRATVARIRREVEADFVEFKRDRVDGPRFGPGRAELRAIEWRKFQRRELRRHVAQLMPGKHPGRFVRP